MRILLFLICLVAGVTTFAGGTKILKSFECDHNGKKVAIYPTTTRLGVQAYESEGLTNAMPGSMLFEITGAEVSGAEYTVQISKDYAGIGNFEKGFISVDESTGVGLIQVINYRSFRAYEPEKYSLKDCKNVPYKSAGVAVNGGWALEKPNAKPN